MTALVPTLVNRTSGADIDASMVPATVADTMPAGPANYLHVQNASGSPVTVTLTPAAGGQVEGTSLAPFALTPPVAATTGDMIYGPLPQNPWGDTSGTVHISYSAFASVTVGALTIPGV